MAIPWRMEQGLGGERVATEVADGVYWFGANTVNWYLLAGEERLTIVDAGLPDHWELLSEGLDTLGYELSDVEALVLTHADPDHLGLGERLRENGVPVWVHEDDHEAALAGGADFPLRDLRHLWRPSLIRFVRAQMRAGVGAVQGIETVRTFEDGQQLDVPGKPTAVHLPGHTIGHCAFWVPDRKVLFVGDALATMDPLRGTECEPAPVRIANADDDRAKESVRVLAEFEDVTLLPGHGRPWEGHLGDALTLEMAEVVE